MDTSISSSAAVTAPIADTAVAAAATANTTTAAVTTTADTTFEAGSTVIAEPSVVATESTTPAATPVLKVGEILAAEVVYVDHDRGYALVTVDAEFDGKRALYRGRMGADQVVGDNKEQRRQVFAELKAGTKTFVVVTDIGGRDERGRLRFGVSERLVQELEFAKGLVGKQVTATVDREVQYGVLTTIDGRITALLRDREMLSGGRPESGRPVTVTVLQANIDEQGKLRVAVSEIAHAIQTRLDYIKKGGPLDGTVMAQEADVVLIDVGSPQTGTLVGRLPVSDLEAARDPHSTRPVVPGKGSSIRVRADLSKGTKPGDQIWLLTVARQHAAHPSRIIGARKPASEPKADGASQDKGKKNGKGQDKGKGKNKGKGGKK